MVLSSQTEVTLSALSSAFHNAGLGGPPPLLAGEARFVEPGTAAGNGERSELAALGLVDQRGRPTDEFEDALYALARADTQCVAHVVNQGERYAILIATRGRTSVTALSDGERVRLKLASDISSPGYALAWNLPEYRAARVTTFSLPQDEFRADGGDGGYESGEMRPRKALEIDAMFRQPRYGLGEITVSARARDGHRRTAEGQLSYLDLADGRVTFEISGSPRNRYLTVMPGDPDLLAGKVDRLRASLNG
ncbi:ESX secretion-associated protein EspG [Amycolatopsis panacis]|uniref:ESX secretion-associated protein EspG n=1 Tax=Amycolatopsis panacis TaxID=2340917 RepID=A0A419HRA3_9PSEU|nr:ESX secretion-associated protein EspG [Amycolatopsis panacis]RJQ79103.1 ESX secretion-associated protein EspG [Amycolatopsis panacis]